MQTSTATTTDLIRRARAGDSQALGQLLEACRDHLRRLAERQVTGRVAVRADASDVVQQALLEAHRAIGQFQGSAEPEWLAWLGRILDRAVARVIRDHALLQKRNVRRERSLEPAGDSSGLAGHLAGHSTPSVRVARGEEQECLQRALGALPPDQREAIRLRHLEELPLAEIAQRLGRSPAATAGLIKRGLQALRRLLNEPGAWNRDVTVVRKEASDDSAGQPPFG
jgi:RNA polymerase sigma-70 factor (ECF subfamily)